MMFLGPGTAVLEFVRFRIHQTLTVASVTLLGTATVLVIVNGREQLSCPFNTLEHENQSFTLNPSNPIELRPGDDIIATLKFPEGLIIAEGMTIDAELKITSTDPGPGQKQAPAFDPFADIQRRVRRHFLN